MQDDQPDSTTKRPRGRPRLGPEHRDRVIAATLELLEEQGSQGLQARLIARRTGLSVGSLYKLVGDVEEIAREANLRTFRELFDILVAALRAAEGASLHRQLMALSRAYLDFVQAHPRRMEAVITFRHTTGEPPDWYQKAEDDLFAILEDRLSELPGARDREQRFVAARAVWAAVHGIVTVTPLGSRAEDPLEDAVRQLELILKGVERELAVGN
ncbi:TetR/AcrR family transcriptional regulator [Marinicauda sp. Alg238-R41]|uniref:TetR/AcrR family transcriptional regulator n=1 Tax=Marinicauda sp. Alg238-R41 TaxID=2993447 RepID=UPI0022E75DB7|nr:TetR/AcrR family transcriptional regulator [Marinicauda sp. Alg238-R41]